MNPTQKLTAIIILAMGSVTGTIVSDALILDTALCTIVDPKTNLTCDQISDAPEQDLYFIVDSDHFDDSALWEKSHQDPETVRWNNDRTQFILKYDVLELPRGQVGAQHGLHDPKNHTEIVEILNSTPWLIIDPNDPTVKGNNPKSFVNDDNIEPE